MPIQTSLGALVTFKQVLPDNGYVITFENANANASSNGFFDIANTFDINGNDLYLVGNTSFANGNTYASYVKLTHDTNSNLPDVNYDAFYAYNDSGNFRISAGSFVIKNGGNVNVIGTVNDPGISNTRPNLLTQTFLTINDSNNSLTTNRIDEPEDSTFRRNPQSAVLDTSNNSITVTGFTSNATTTIARWIKNYISNGALATWEKVVRSNTTNLTPFVYNFDSTANLYTCSANNSIFDLSNTGTTLSNIVTFSTAITFTDIAIDNTNNRYAIINNPRRLTKLSGNSIVYEKSTPANTFIQQVVYDNGNIYLGTRSISPYFINIACLDANTGNVNWQKNIEFSAIGNNSNNSTFFSSIRVNNNNVYVSGTATTVDTNAPFLINIPADGSNLSYNSYKVGNLVLNIGNGNLSYTTSSNLALTTPANLNLINANVTIVNNLGLTANTDNTWTYNSRRI